MPSFTSQITDIRSLMRILLNTWFIHFDPLSIKILSVRYWRYYWCPTVTGSIIKFKSINMYSESESLEQKAIVWCFVKRENPFLGHPEVTKGSCQTLFGNLFQVSISVSTKVLMFWRAQKRAKSRQHFTIKSVAKLLQNLRLQKHC